MQFKRQPEPAKDQQELPFRIQISKLLLKRLGLTPAAKHLLRVFVSAIDDKPTRQVFLSARTMADAIEGSIRQVRSATKELRTEELICRIAGPRAGRRCDTFLVRIVNLWERGGVIFHGAPECKPCTPPSGPRVQILHSAECKPCTSVDASPYFLNRKVNEKEEDSPPTPSLSEWNAVAAALSDYGIDQAAAAVSAAQANGVTPEHVQELLGIARRRGTEWASPQGVLYQRIVSARPDRPVADGWPRSSAERAAVNPSRVHSDGPKFWDKFSQSPEAVE